MLWRDQKRSTTATARQALTVVKPFAFLSARYLSGLVDVRSDVPASQSDITRSRAQSFSSSGASECLHPGAMQRTSHPGLRFHPALPQLFEHRGWLHTWCETCLWLWTNLKMSPRRIFATDPGLEYSASTLGAVPRGRYGRRCQLRPFWNPLAIPGLALSSCRLF